MHVYYHEQVHRSHCNYRAFIVKYSRLEIQFGYLKKYRVGGSTLIDHPYNINRQLNNDFHKDQNRSCLYCYIFKKQVQIISLQPDTLPRYEPLKIPKDHYLQPGIWGTIFNMHKLFNMELAVNKWYS